MDDRRLGVRAKIVFRSEYSTPEHTIGQGLVQDLSIRGCRVKASSRVQVDDTFRLQLFLPQCPAPIQIEQARIRWVHGQEFGCQFLVILPEERDRLRQVLAGLESTDGGPIETPC